MTPPSYITVVCGFISNHQGLILLTERLAHKPFGLLFEFPGGKVEPQESPEEALKRELFEEIGIYADIGQEIARTTYHHGNLCIKLALYDIIKFSGELTAKEVKSFKWVDTTWLSTHLDQIPPADHALLPQIAQFHARKHPEHTR